VRLHPTNKQPAPQKPPPPPIIKKKPPPPPPPKKKQTNKQTKAKNKTKYEFKHLIDGTHGFGLGPLFFMV